MKVRQGGRVINAVVLVSTGINNDGKREVLGPRAATSETLGRAANSSPTWSPPLPDSFWSPVTRTQAYSR